MKKYLFSFLITLISISAYSQEIHPYKLYDKSGNRVEFKDLVKSTKGSDIVLFGEIHNNPISHWMKYELIEFVSRDNEITLGAEFFEADDQNHLDNFINDEISYETFDSLARLWPNYATDYSAIVNLARESNIDFIATNIPRIYARFVHRFGFESLDTISEEQKQFIAPLPIDYDPTLPGYKNMMKMGEAMGHSVSENFPKAQAIKDATMAYFILKNFKESNIFIHINGSYHSDNFEGILWYLKNENSDLRYLTVSTVIQENVESLKDEYIGRADYILVVNQNVTTSY